MNSTRFRVAAAVLSVGVASVSQAATTITTPFSGVTYSKRVVTVPNLMSINVADFDLGAPGIRFQMTPKAGTGNNEYSAKTVVTAVNNVQAQVGINASFFFQSTADTTATDGTVTYTTPTEGNGTSGLLLRGLVASDGNLYSPFERDSRPWPVMNIAQNNVVSFVKRVVPSRPSGGVRPINSNTTPALSLYNAMSGSEQIVTNGVNTADTSTVTYGEPTGNRSRSGVGVTANKHLLMFTIDEGSATSAGATWSEFAEIMRGFGVVNGINLDGGGSTSMAMRLPGQSAALVNTSSDPTRGVGTQLFGFANAPTTTTNKFVYADYLLGDTGSLASAPTQTGTIAASTTSAAFDTGGVGERGWVDKLTIKDDAANSADWTIRQVSGSGARPGTRATNTPRVADGFLGVWAKTADAGVSLTIALDETSDTSTERGALQSLIADGQWHLYQWNIDDASQWDSDVNGDGAINSADFTIDSLRFFGSADAVVYYDEVTHNARGMVPEPASLLALVALSWTFAARSTRSRS